MDEVSPELDGFCVPESLGQVACRERKCVCVCAGESGFPLPVSQLADHQPDWPPPPMGPLPGGHINLVPCDSERHIINIVGLRAQSPRLAPAQVVVPSFPLIYAGGHGNPIQDSDSGFVGGLVALWG